MATPAPPPWQRDAATWQPRAATGRSPKGVQPTTSKPLRILSVTSTHLARAVAAGDPFRCKRMALEMYVMFKALFLRRPPRQRAARTYFMRTEGGSYNPDTIGTGTVTEAVGMPGVEWPPMQLYLIGYVRTFASSEGSKEWTTNPVDMRCIATAQSFRLSLVLAVRS